MIYLLLSILSSSSLLLIFSLFKKFGVKNLGAIVVNYIVAALFGLLFLDAPLPFRDIPGEAWFPWAIGIGLLFILMFNLIATSTQRVGITVTTIANKMSLVIPVAAAYFLYQDSMSLLKVVGITAALVGVYLSAARQKGGPFSGKALLLPLAVFIFAGLLDTVVKYVQQTFLQEAGLTSFLPVLFTAAALTGLLTLAVLSFIKKVQLGKKEILGGILLGVPNYFSIYFLVKTLEIEYFESSMIFPINNIGIVVLSSILAYLFFAERLQSRNWMGILLSIAAIILVWLSSIG